MTDGYLVPDAHQVGLAAEGVEAGAEDFNIFTNVHALATEVFHRVPVEPGGIYRYIYNAADHISS
jgi:hypothetical protein